MLHPRSGAVWRADTNRTFSLDWIHPSHPFAPVGKGASKGDRMDDLLILEGSYTENGCVRLTEKPGSGFDLNPNDAKAHQVDGESWWG